MQRIDVLVVVGQRETLGLAERLLKLRSELVDAHVAISFVVA